MRTMKAAVFVRPGKIVLEDKPVPTAGPGEAVGWGWRGVARCSSVHVGPAAPQDVSDAVTELTQPFRSRREDWKHMFDQNADSDSRQRGWQDP